MDGGGHRTEVHEGQNLSKEFTEAAAALHATVPVCHGLCGNVARCGLLTGFSILVV
jgi:hypothetical protein